MSERKVSIIRPTIDLPLTASGGEYTRRRVAAYARVSTDEDEQLSSYDAQVDFYTRHIQSNPKWEFVEVYADEGISGTNTKKREDFNRMVDDALAGMSSSPFLQQPFALQTKGFPQENERSSISGEFLLW